MVKTLVMKHCIPMTKVLRPVLLSRVFGLDIFIQTKRIYPAQTNVSPRHGNNLSGQDVAILKTRSRQTVSG